jgi:NAD(P)-dependent dehydrogenase (short-subunit alcohol dehydrogenase family)
MPNYLITGANAGLGLDACRQLALRGETGTVYLACRSSDKARKAIQRLVEHNGCPEEKLQYIHFDAAERKDEIEKIALSFDQVQLEGLILNAGGTGDEASRKPTGPNGVLHIVQINLIAHVQLVQILQQKRILSDGCRVVYSGSESARGIPMFFAPAPAMGDDVAFYSSFMTGSSNIKDLASMYGAVKGAAALYFAAFAQKNSNLFVLTTSPGGTWGTNILFQKSIPWIGMIIVKLLHYIAYLLGRFQSVEDGARKYVDSVTGACDHYASGTFLGCASDLAGSLCDQTTSKNIPGGRQYANTTKQKAAYEAIQAFL